MRTIEKERDSLRDKLTAIQAANAKLGEVGQ
jgi:hypothetical protein